MYTATLTGFLVLFYQVVTFYLYLALGTFFLPRWVARVFGARKNKSIPVLLTISYLSLIKSKKA